MKRSFPFLCALLLSGYAGATSSEIRATPKSDLPYAARSCQELVARLQDTEAELATKSEANDL